MKKKQMLDTESSEECIRVRLLHRLLSSAVKACSKCYQDDPSDLVAKEKKKWKRANKMQILHSKVIISK